MTQIRDRIRELRRVPAGELRANPRNYRTHPEPQRAALRGILAEVGLADALLAYETPDGLTLVDGHLRLEECGDQVLPVLVLDVTEAEADKLLLTLDPLAAMAEQDAAKLDALLRDVQTAAPALADMFTTLAEDAGMFDAAGADAPELADGDRQPFRQMTFTVHDSQFELIESALKKAKSGGGHVSDVNENSNGNALAFICEGFVNGAG